MLHIPICKNEYNPGEVFHKLEYKKYRLDLDYIPNLSERVYNEVELFLGWSQYTNHMDFGNTIYHRRVSEDGISLLTFYRETYISCCDEMRMKTHRIQNDKANYMDGHMVR